MNRQELQLMLEENIPCIEGKKIWIWGTGNTARLYQNGLKRVDLFEICGYCDNNSGQWGEEFAGEKIVSPDELMKYSDVLVFICSSQPDVVQTIGRQLDEMKIEWYGIAEAIFKLYRNEVMNCYDLLEDQFSKDTYAHIISCYLSNTVPDDCYITGGEYFWLKQFRLLRNEVYVDCGAYTGDTIEKYIWKRNGIFKKIIAFEPDRQNFEAMQYRMERVKKEWNLSEDSVELFCCGVGAEKGKQAFLASGTLRSVCLSENTCAEQEYVDIVSIDQFVKEPYHFLKVDIEGYEFNMLLGARESIRRNRPVLAICIYHNAIDMFSLMLYIHELVPEYKFSVRHHGDVLEDTVLYAYIGG